ncbi:MAG: hypothetical protein AAGF79_02585 [Pseudomonadota bacterium]
MIRLPSLPSLTALCLLAATPMALANSFDSAGGRDKELTFETTSQLIRQLNQDFQRCFELEPNYRYDCYDDAYFRGARTVRENPAYEPVEQVLREVGEDIQSIVARNKDPDLPDIQRGFSTFQPIKTEALPMAKARVLESIEEAQTVLLRTPETGGENFQRIAAALESNKVLLRSALIWIRSVLRIA